VKKALIAAGVAVAALAGVIVAVVVSSGGTTNSERLPSTSLSQPESTTAATTTGTLTLTTTTELASTTPVPATTAELPPPPKPNSPRRRSFLIGVVDDSLAQQDPASARLLVDISHHAGFDAVTLSATWERGRTTPRKPALRGLRNVAAAARRDRMKLFLVIGHGLASTTPRSSHDRSQFAKFAANVVREVPGVTGIVVDNEPNLPFFWQPQFDSDGNDVAATAYEDLLARTYDAVKDAAPRVRVIGGGLAPRGTDDPHRLRTHSPTAFIHDLGAAYRSSSRGAPLMDAFAIHPYNRPEEPPTLEHQGTTQITIADYAKLVTLLDNAFRGSHQRGRTLPILYTEFGVQTMVPRSKRSLYATGTTPKADLGVSAATQAAYYREALALAYCQPTVKGLFVFHTFDEPNLDGWQSGLYYADRTPKPSLRGFRKAVRALRKGYLTTCRR
jgi:hypothetical protein